MLNYKISQNKVFVILIGIVLLIVFTGCTQTSNQIVKGDIKHTSTATSPIEPLLSSSTPTSTRKPEATSTPKPTSSLGITQDDLAGIKVVFWHTWMGDAGKVVDEITEAFNSQNKWGIQVEASYQGNIDEIDEKLHAAIDNGQPPDIVVGYHYQTPDWDSAWGLIDLNEYVSDPVWGLSTDEKDDFYPAFWNQDQNGDKRMGVPAQRSGQLLYYNATWAKELGFSSPPSTPEEFIEQACAAARANQKDEDPDNDRTGGLIISTHYAAMLNWMNAFGADITSSNEKTSGGDTYDFDNHQVEESLTFLRKLYDQGCAWLSMEQYPQTDFAARRGLFAIDSVIAIPYQQAAFLQSGNTDWWTVIPYPTTQNESNLSVYGPSFEILTSTPEEQLASWLFIKWLLMPQNQAELVEKTSAFPLRRSVIDILNRKEVLHPQWFTAASALDSAKAEPNLSSWRLVRWAVSDASTQLYRFYFTIDQIPNLVEFLNETANDLARDPLKDSSIKSSTKTPMPERTATVDAAKTSPLLTTEPDATKTPAP